MDKSDPEEASHIGNAGNAEFQFLSNGLRQVLGENSYTYLSLIKCLNLFVLVPLNNNLIGCHHFT